MVIRAIKAVAVKAAANEMTSSIAKVISVHARDVTSAETAHAAPAETADVACAEAADATSAEAADAASTEATHVTSAKAAHVASTATTSMSTATATAGLCVSGKKAAGKHCTCQNHHHSSSHNTLLWVGGTFRHRALSDAGVSEEDKYRRRDGLKMRILICRCH